MDKTPERRRMKMKHGSSPGIWKERFRQGCLDRLKSKRHSLVNSFRQSSEKDPDSPQSSQETVNQVMLDEWNQMKLESPILSNIRYPRRGESNFGDDGNDFPEEIEDILDVFEDIQIELLREEDKILTQYEDLESFDDKYLCSTIEMLSTDSVMCPVCKKKNLLQNKQVIFCACGLRVDTQYDSIDLQYVGKQLHESVTNHSSSCIHEPDFYVADLSGIGIKNLIMSCRACDALVIII